MNVAHLSTVSLLDILDGTSVSFQGRVSFPNMLQELPTYGTYDSYEPQWPTYTGSDESGCAMGGVQVCAIDLDTQAEVGCVISNFEGAYGLALSAGLRVYLELLGFHMKLADYFSFLFFFS